MTGLTAEGFPEAAVRDRARHGAASAFPDVKEYGCTVHGQRARSRFDALDSFQIVPPVFMPGRMEKLIELGREPLYHDVDLRTEIGGFSSQLPVSLSAFGSTRVASTDLGIAASTQAGRASRW